MKKILIAGESWTVVTMHVKGVDQMVMGSYEEVSVQWLQSALEKAGYEIDYMPAHTAYTDFPQTAEELKQYSLVILSDIGSNTLYLHPDTYMHDMIKGDRCMAIRDYVQDGGAFCMIGGYISFTGLEAKARYGMTPVSEVLPVELLTGDDRVERPAGIHPITVDTEHPVMKGMPKEWPTFLGYNKTIANPEIGQVLATINGDPFVAVGEFGKGRSAAVTSDCAPHWASKEYLESDCYNTFWGNLANWLTEKEEA